MTEEIKELLEWIKKRCDSLDDDCLEGDKVMCHAQAIRYKINVFFAKDREAKSG